MSRGRVRSSVFQPVIVFGLLVGLFALEMLIWCRDNHPASSSLRVCLFEVPPIQSHVKEWQEGGIPKIMRKWGDVSYLIPDKGIVFQKKAQTAEIKDLIETIRLRYPETVLGSDLETICIYCDSIVISEEGGDHKFSRRIDDGRGRTFFLEIAVQKQLVPSEHRAQIHLLVKEETKETNGINSNFAWNAAQQLFIGFPSYLGKGKKGSVYFLVLFME